MITFQVITPLQLLQRPVWLLGLFQPLFGNVKILQIIQLFQKCQADTVAF